MESVMKRTTATGFLSTCAISLALFSSGVSVLGSTLVHEENRANDMAQVDKKPVAVVLFITDSILELSF